MTRIRELREGKGVTLIGMSFETQIHPSTLSAVERRRLVPGPRVRKAVSKFLGVEESEAFGGDGLAA